MYSSRNIFVVSKCLDYDSHLPPQVNIKTYIMPVKSQGPCFTNMV